MATRERAVGDVVIECDCEGQELSRFDVFLEDAWFPCYTTDADAQRHETLRAIFVCPYDHTQYRQLNT